MSRTTILTGVVPKGYENQVDAVLSQASPGTGVKYTVLNTTINCRIIRVAAKVTWTVQPTPLEIHITIDGQNITFVKSDPVSNIYYVFVGLNASDMDGVLGATTYSDRRGMGIIEGRNVKVQAETTGGTSSNLTCRVKYAKIP